MAETIEALERRIDGLRVAVREAVLVGDLALASVRRAELRQAEQAWEDALVRAAAPQAAPASGPRVAPAQDPRATSATGPRVAPGQDPRATPAAGPQGAPGQDPRATSAAGPQGAPAQDPRATPAAEPWAAARPAEPSGSLLPLREQVYEALSLLQVPAAPKLIATVHEAFFGSTFPTTRVTSLKRDEERSFRTAPFARPYYICAALSADYLSPSRGLLAVSTWPMERRVIGPLSPRVDFLTAAIRVADAIERIPTPPPTARRLLQRFAASIPGAAPVSGATAATVSPDEVRPDVVRQAADAELSVHAKSDSRMRKDAAERARRQLTDAEQFFGTKLQPVIDEAGTAG